MGFSVLPAFSAQTGDHRLPIFQQQVMMNAMLLCLALALGDSARHASNHILGLLRKYMDQEHVGRDNDNDVIIWVFKSDFQWQATLVITIYLVARSLTFIFYGEALYLGAVLGRTYILDTLIQLRS